MLTYPYKHILISRRYKLYLASPITHCPIVITNTYNQKKNLTKRLLPLRNIWIFRTQETSNFLINILWLWRFHNNPHTNLEYVFQMETKSTARPFLYFYCTLLSCFFLERLWKACHCTSKMNKVIR
jgi:hypothetical protein